MADLVVTALSELLPGPVSRRELDRGGGRRLRWIEAGGESNPTVVLVAGAGEMALDWAIILPVLANRYRIVAYDRAGLGASDPIAPLTVETELEDLVALLANVGPAVVVGHSWGGLLAQLAAFAQPDPILGLVLVDSTHEDVFASIPWVLNAASAVMLTGLLLLTPIGLFGRIAQGIGRSLAQRCTEDPRIRILISDAYVASYATHSQVRTIRSENRLAVRSAALVRQVRAVSTLPDVPVVVLSATAGKPRSVRELATTLAQQVAASASVGEHIVVDGSGHYIHHDRPEQVIKAIDDVVEAARANPSPPRAEEH
jgi:pimeloyl-ACP methyl ester carboxylesterase